MCQTKDMQVFMDDKEKIWVVNLTLHGHYTCVYSVQSYWHKYRKQNMSAKQIIHKWSLMIENNGSQMHSTPLHITAVPKVY